MQSITANWSMTKNTMRSLHTYPPASKFSELSCLHFQSESAWMTLTRHKAYYKLLANTIAIFLHLSDAHTNVTTLFIRLSIQNDLDMKRFFSCFMNFAASTGAKEASKFARWPFKAQIHAIKAQPHWLGRQEMTLYMPIIQGNTVVSRSNDHKQGSR